MQAMILAAGMGKRLRHATAGKPKCLVEVDGTSLLLRALAALARCRPARIVLVIGYKGDMIRRLVGNVYAGIPVEYVENPDFETTNNIYSLYLARELLAADDTLLLESDVIFEDAVLDKLVADPNPNVVVVDRYRPHMDGTVVKISPAGDVTAIIPKAHFNPAEIDSYFKTVNIYKFSKSFSTGTYIPFLEAYCAVLGRNRFYEQVLRVILTLDQNNLRALVLAGEKWFEIDTLPDLRTAEILFAATPERKLQLVGARYGGYWEFTGLLDFCYLTNPFFPPPRLLEELRSASGELLSSYPSGQETQALLAGEFLQCREQALVVGNGAAELIAALARVLQGTVGLMYPTFMEYPARLAPEKLIKFRPGGENLSYSAQDLLEAAPRADTLLLVNPDNPSGNFIPRPDLLTLVRRCGELNKRLIVDESFVDFADGAPHSLITDDVLSANPHLIVLRSISKTYGVPGARLGILATGDRELVEKLRREVAIWNINSFGEFFLRTGLKYAGEYHAACRAVAAARADMFRLLAAVPFLSPLPSAANFVLCRVGGGRTSSALAEELLFRHNIFIKSFANREGLENGEYVRLAVRRPGDNRLLVEKLTELAERRPSWR